MNINSIRNKFQTIEFILKNAYVDFLSLSETKLDESFPGPQFHVPNYDCLRNDRSVLGGGLMFYIRPDIPHRRRLDLEQMTDNHAGLEIIILEVMLNKKERWIYVLGSKPPSIADSVFKNTFDLLCDDVLGESQNIVLLGDYNCDFRVDNTLHDICNSYDISNLVTSAPCFTSDKGTLLDLCIASKPFRFRNTLNLDCWLSDFHNLICITTKLNVPKR